MDGAESNDGGAAPSMPDLTAAVYAQLRSIAQQQMNAERAGHTLSATALVNEAYLRLEAGGRAGAMGRGQFLHAAAEAMRRILIEHARRRGRQKRGGSRGRVSLDAIGDVADLASEEQSEHIVAFDEAFGRLEESAPRLAGLVRLRFFAGLSIKESAAALGVSERTANIDWLHARAWLARELMSGGD